MSVIDVLRDGRRLYAAGPSHAPRGDFPDAGCVCAVMALAEAAEGEPNDTFSDSLAAVRSAVGAESLIDWNATHSTEEVLAAFDEAIARAGDLSVLFGSGDVEVDRENDRV